jgi:glucose/arabinose dehydrogenase
MLAAATPATASHADLIPAPIPPSGITVGLSTVADGLVSPVWGVAAPGVSTRLYVADQPGRIWSIDVRGAAPKREFADLRPLVGTLGCFGIGYDERGLLGLVFDPRYKRNGMVYTYIAEVGDDVFEGSNCFLPQPNHQNVLTRWRVRDPRDPDTTIDPASGRELLRVDHPQFNHNGGALAFGPDGMLYVGIGDGGGADDEGPGHSPGGNGQDLGNLLGKILRIDPRRPDVVPRGNPFARVPGARPEIWAYGFRNPYRFTFAGGRLIAGDAGQNDIEELDIVRRGRNYGWPVKEGTFLFDQDGGPDGDGDGDPDGRAVSDSPGAPAGMTDPVYQYDHGRLDETGALVGGEGISIIGGYRYEDQDIRALRRSYVFGDYSRTFPAPGLPAPVGRVFVRDRSGGVGELAFEGRDTLGRAVLGFARDAKGAVYVLASTTGNVTGTTGVVLKLVRSGG